MEAGIVHGLMRVRPSRCNRTTSVKVSADINGKQGGCRKSMDTHIPAHTKRNTSI